MTTLTRLLFIRHGRSIWNETGRWQGHADPPLSEAGLEQVRRLIARLQRVATIDHVYASDLERARVTATMLAEAFDRPLTVDAVWRERGIGPLEGLTTEEVMTQFPDVWASRLRGPIQVPGGESPEEVRRRAAIGCEAVLARHSGQTVAIVSHGGMILATLSHLLDLGGMGFARLNGGYNTGISQVDVIDGYARLERLNDHAHLE